MSQKLTVKTLFAYADKYARKKEMQGLGTQYPTLRQVARRYHTTIGEIEEVAGDWIEDGYLGIACAVGISGGYAEIKTKGNWLVEAYR